MPRVRKRKSDRSPNRTMLRRALFLLSVCGIVAFIVLGVQLYRIQILEHDRYESAAIESQVRETTVAANRGTIYDRTGKILAMSYTVETIYISPKEIQMYNEDPVFIAQSLANLLGVDYAKILEMTADTSSWYKTVARKVERETADRVREFKNEHDLKGVKIEPDSKRSYPYSSLAAHVIGFVGMENKGMSGIEYSLDPLLAGTAGSIARMKNSAGTDMLFTKFEDYYDAEPGSNLTLTVDTTIQYYMEKHLRQAVADYDVQNGAAAIAMNPQTGAILGMVSLGDFDLNNYQLVAEDVQTEIDALEDPDAAASALDRAQQLQWRNKGVMDTYEPGSTFKLITLAMALEEGTVHIHDSFFCDGRINVTGREADDPVKCWKLQGHGAQTLTQAVQHSCNVAFVNIGLRMGTQTFYKYCEAFGFFDRSENRGAQLSGKTGIELPGEEGSLWWSYDTFVSQNLSQLAAASFGQTFNITPLQLITAVSACVNGGYLMQPYLVNNVTDAEGETISHTEPTVVRQVISEETSATVRGIMEQVVGDRVEGTGKNAYVAGYRIGGKTGTSTNTVKEGETGEKEYIVSFIGVAPMDDPQIAILVLLDCPSQATGIYPSGGQMGAPTVGKMMADILPYLGVEAQYTEDEVQRMDRSVPSLVGLSVEEAQSNLMADGFNFRVIGPGGAVTKQLPSAGAVVAVGSQVILYADAEPSEEQEEVPDLTGLTYSIARERLGYYGLFLRTNSSLYYESATIQVTTQSIVPGTLVDHGTVVEVSLADKDATNYGMY